MSGSNTERFVKDGLKISGTAALLSVGSEYLLQRTNLSHGARGGVQAAAGAVIAVATMKYAPNVAMGAFAFALVAGTRGAAQEYQLRRLLSSTAAQPTALPAAAAAQTPVTGSGTSGGALPASTRDNLYSTFMAEQTRSAA